MPDHLTLFSGFSSLSLHILVLKYCCVLLRESLYSLFMSLYFCNFIGIFGNIFWFSSHDSFYLRNLPLHLSGVPALPVDIPRCVLAAARDLLYLRMGIFEDGTRVQGSPKLGMVDLLYCYHEGGWGLSSHHLAFSQPHPLSAKVINAWGYPTVPALPINTGPWTACAGSVQSSV